MKALIRIFGLVVMVDGLLSAVFGHAYLERLRGVLPRPMHAVLDGLERVPPPLFRLGGLLQAASGGHLLAHGSPWPKKGQGHG